MLAALGLFAGEALPHPFFDGTITGPAIYQFQQTYTSEFPFFWAVLVATIGGIELNSIANNWTTPAQTFGEEGGRAKLKDEAVPGGKKINSIILS